MRGVRAVLGGGSVSASTGGRDNPPRPIDAHDNCERCGNLERRENLAAGLCGPCRGIVQGRVGSGVQDVQRRLARSERGSTKPAKGDQNKTNVLHSPPESSYTVHISCMDAETADAIVQLAARLAGVRVVVENPEEPHR